MPFKLDEFALEARFDGAMRPTVLTTALCLLAVWPAASWACSCMPFHPQEHYCTADFGRYTASYYVFGIEVCT